MSTKKKTTKKTKALSYRFPDTALGWSYLAMRRVATRIDEAPGEKLGLEKLRALLAYGDAVRTVLFVRTYPDSCWTTRELRELLMLRADALAAALAPPGGQYRALQRVCRRAAKDFLREAPNLPVIEPERRPKTTRKTTKGRK